MIRLVAVIGTWKPKEMNMDTSLNVSTAVKKFLDQKENENEN